MSNLEKYLLRPVSDLVAPPDVRLVEGMMERHTIYSLLVLAGIREFWCGNKYGRDAKYPLSPTAADGAVGKYLDRDYVGHNIACIAVDADGCVIDFDFNHNELFNSSAEHAESRLVRRVFLLTQIHDTWNTGERAQTNTTYGNLLKNISVYTSLESCSQCSGIMALGQVKEVVYLQQDPGMYYIGNILRRLTEGTELQAPLPIAGSDFQLPHYRELNARYQEFTAQQTSETGEPFVILPSGKKRYSNSISSFLCTKSAYEVFTQAARDLESLSTKYAAFKPTEANGSTVESALNNAAALTEAKSFLSYMKNKGHRGTPHH